MVELSKNCSACDAALSAGADSCHRCGRSLSNEETDSVAVEMQNLFAENLLVENEAVSAKTLPVADNAAITETLEKPEINSEAEAVTKTQLTTTESANSQTKAATKGNAGESIVVPPPRTKRYVARPDYVWTEAAAPTWRILSFSLLVFVLAALLLWLNNFLR